MDGLVGSQSQAHGKESSRRFWVPGRGLSTLEEAWACFAHPTGGGDQTWAKPQPVQGRTPWWKGD
jgi:hypothetical protein